ncbi:MAG: nuclear transport factor 2 family protein [Gammaproteobacteria bacterium]|nr:nuclear transport factor 2 family protein [Gammaproteobacteria bacterium]
MPHDLRLRRATVALLWLVAAGAPGAAPAAPATPVASSALSASSAPSTLSTLTEQVRATEIAFAKTLADRDLAAFRRFLAADAVFVQDPPLRGPDAITAGWRGYFDGATAPFSWAPDTIAVLDSGRLALSSGPVLAPDGHRIGTFNSVWRRERDGHWRIVLDRGCPRCNCPPAAPAS